MCRNLTPQPLTTFPYPTLDTLKPLGVFTPLLPHQFFPKYFKHGKRGGVGLPANHSPGRANPMKSTSSASGVRAQWQTSALGKGCWSHAAFQSQGQALTFLLSWRNRAEQTQTPLASYLQGKGMVPSFPKHLPKQRAQQHTLNPRMGCRRCWPLPGHRGREGTQCKPLSL